MAPGLRDVSYSTNAANALIHLYRAEVGKMTAYRQRLDMTTNWSVVTTAGLASFALGDPNNSHATFLFAMFMNYFFYDSKPGVSAPTRLPGTAYVSWNASSTRPCWETGWTPAGTTCCWRN